MEHHAWSGLLQHIYHAPIIYILLAPLSGALAVHMVCDPSNPSIHPIQHVAFECSQLFLIVQSVSRSQPSPAQPSPAQNKK